MLQFWRKKQNVLSEKRIFALVLGLALVLRLPLLNGSFWLDEAAQALESTRPFQQQFDIAADFQPPFFHLLVHLLSYVSHDEWWLRLASLIPGLASIALAMFLAQRWFGKGAGLVAGAYLATSSLHIFYSQELRPYMLAVFFALASIALLEAWKGETFVLKKDWKQALSLGSIVAFGVYSSYVMIFWWPAVFLLSLVWDRKSWKFIFVSGLFGLLFFFPWAMTGLRDQLAIGAALRETLPGWDSVVSLSSAKALPLVLAKFLSGVERIDFNAAFGLLLGVPYILLGLLGTFVWKSGHFKKDELKRVYWLISLFVAPLVLAWIFSWVTPVIAPKRVLYLLPILALLLGAITSHARKLGLVVFVLFMSWNVWSLARYWSDPLLQRENWRQLVADISAQLPPSTTAIVMAHDAPFAPWRWYASPEYQAIGTGLAPLQSASSVSEKIAPILNMKTILVFDYLRDLSDPYKVIESALQNAGYQEKTVFDYPGIGFVRVYMQDTLYAGGVL